MTVTIELQPVVTMWIPVVVHTRGGGGGNSKTHASSVGSRNIASACAGMTKRKRHPLVLAQWTPAVIRLHGSGDGSDKLHTTAVGSHNIDSRPNLSSAG